MSDSDESNNSREAVWKALREDLGGEDSDADSEPAEIEKKTVRRKSDRKPKSVKTKQRTIPESSKSSANIDDILKKFKESEAQDEDINVSKLLEESDDDDYDEDGNSPTAVDFLATLTSKKEPELRAVEKPAEEINIKLEDETFDYPTEAKNTTKGKKTSAPPVKTENAGSRQLGYLAVDKPKQEVKILKDFKTNQPTNVTVSNVESDMGDLFYWFDAKEQPYYSQVDPGGIYLFGKRQIVTGSKIHYASCCVRVRNMERVLYLYPKENSSEIEVVGEINQLCRVQGIEHMRVKFVEKYYAFEENEIPHGKSIWAEVRYPGRFPTLSIKEPCNHITSIVGSSYSLLELFLLEKKIMGPCFLQLGNIIPSTIRISHCEEEYIVDNPQNIFMVEKNTSPPPLTFCSIQLHSQLDSTGSCTEIIAVGISVYKNVNVEGSLKTTPDELYIGIRPISGSTIPIDLESFCNKRGLNGVKRFSNEILLLRWIAATLGSVDPDFLVGHNFLSFTVNTLLRRYQDLNIPQWSTIGRLDLKKFPRFHGQSTAQEKEVCVGRLVADSYLLARENYKSVNYKLFALANQMKILGFAEQAFEFEPGVSVITPEIQASSKSLFDVLIPISNTTLLSMGVIAHLDAIRLTKRLSSVAGNLWSHTLYGARSERIEYLLLHTFYGLDFVLPDKKRFDLKRSRDDEEGEERKKKSKYQGGMVLDPKCGLYSDYILLLDFNSLYPSLIQEFNICFTTVERGADQAEIPPPETLVCDSCAEKGVAPPCRHKCILPKVIKSLVDSRREVKRLMKTERDPNNLALLEIRQKSLKLTANSMYGCLGFEHSRFYAQSLAELVTRQGRIALQNTVDLVPQINPSLRVIYGDTDSVMIQTGVKNELKLVRDMGLEIKAKVNKRYQSLEIDIDGVFRAMLLLKKKKYAALSIVDWETEGKQVKKEIKGLDMVRRDWCPLSKKVSDAVLDRILNADSGEDVLEYIVKYMADVAEHVRLGDRYTLDDFVISKSLTKEPESYKGSSFPHATVALRMKERKEIVRVGDLIPYVICVDGEAEKLNEKAFHVEEARRNKNLSLDSEWYLTSQIYPPVLRLCEHIEGFSAAQLSDAMKIAYHGPAARAENEEHTAEDFSHCALLQCRDIDECFPAALPFQVQCPNCQRSTPINPHKRVLDYIKENPKKEYFDLYICTGCKKSIPVYYLSNLLSQKCHDILGQFYQSGGGSSSVKALRNQFTYFKALFEVPHAPGCPAAVKECHLKWARRCIDLNSRTLCTLSESRDADGEPVEGEPVDPLQVVSDEFYKRIELLYIDLGKLFS